MTKPFEFIAQTIFRLFGISKITFKLGFILVVSIIIPMIIFAYLSLSISIKADYGAVSRGNQEVAFRTAEQIEQYINHVISMMRALAVNVNDLHLSETQKDTVLKNLVLGFKEFDQIAITDRSGKEIVTSEMGGILKDRSNEEAFKAASQGQTFLSDVFISNDFLPTMTIAVPSYLLNEFDGAVIGKINLINMWRLVDSLTIGKQGYALVVSKDGMLIAHGDGNSKPGIIRKENLSHLKIVQETLSGKARILEYENSRGTKVLGATAPIKLVNWGLIIEQPRSEAYASTYKMAKRLVVLGFLILLAMSFIAYIGVNSSVISPLKKLMGGIKEKDVSFDKGDEFSNLANFYNVMSNSVLELETTLEKYAQTAKQGKVSAGLLHDLKHPIDNIIRITRRLSSRTKDDELKKFSRELLEQESKNIHSFISKIKEPLLDSPRFRQPKTSINQVLRNSCKAFQKKFEDKEIKVKMELSRSKLFIEGDPFDFERIIKNLIVNAMEAMEGMKDDRFLGFSSKKENGHVMVSVSDNGPGIEPERLKTLFTDGSSGKKDGWGIGLSVSKALLEKMGGLIEVESSLGKGATFTLKFKSP